LIKKRAKIFDIPEKEVSLQRYKQKKNVTEFTKHPIAGFGHYYYSIPTSEWEVRRCVILS